jgi:glycosyltransferase involved in cell wall biosynthesis
MINDNVEYENLISIVMPVYNSKRFLAMAIESVLRQKSRSYELILVDDGSKDGSGAICDEFADKSQRITVVHKENGGICDARNCGLKLVRGKYVYFMDNDDVLSDDFFETVEPYLQQNHYDMIMFGTRLTDIVGGEVQSQRVRALPAFEAQSNEEFKKHIPSILDKGMHLCVWDKIYRAEFLKQHQASFNRTFTHGGEDLSFNLMLFPFVNSILNLDKTFYNYYIRDDQSTYRKFNPNVYDHAITNLRHVTSMLTQMKIDDSEYLYLKYIEYRQRLVFMLFHQNASLTFSQKKEMCKTEYAKDGYSFGFKVKALFAFCKKKDVSFKKKISAWLNIMGLYGVQLMMIEKTRGNYG